MLNSAARLEDLQIPPGNRLEELRHDRKGQHSIAINDQFRVLLYVAGWRRLRRGDNGLPLIPVGNTSGPAMDLRGAQL